MQFLREFLTVFGVFCGVRAKIYNPCEVGREILHAQVPKPGRSGELEPLQCSTRDIGRLVCVASLHHFDTDYKYTSGNDTYVGIFGLPKERASNVSSIVASQQDLVSYQMYLRRKKLTAVSEVICNYYQWFLDNFMIVRNFWNLSEHTQFGEIWNKRHVHCQDELLRVFVADEKFSKQFYKPGVLDDLSIKHPNETKEDVSSDSTSNPSEDEEFYEKPCHGDFYCGESAKCLQREVFNRVDKSRMERKVNQLVRVIDWTIIVLWFVVVVGGISGGVWYMRNPRRRRRHNDDWGRPIMTAHFSS